MNVMDKITAAHEKVLAGKQLTATEARILINEIVQSDDNDSYWNESDLNHAVVVDAVSRLLTHVEALSNSGQVNYEDMPETPEQMGLRKAREYLSDRCDVNPATLEGQELTDYQTAREIFDNATSNIPMHESDIEPASETLI